MRTTVLASAAVLLLATELSADLPGTSDRWDAAAVRQRIRPLHAAPPAAQALLGWLQSEGGGQLFGLLVDEGRFEREIAGQPHRREVGAAGYVAEGGEVVLLDVLRCSEWYRPIDGASIPIGKADAGVPWALHTHSWGNSMSGTLRGPTDDFAYATSSNGRPGILICLPLREHDGRELLDGGRLQMIVPSGAGIGCFEGRWTRTAGRIELVEETHATH